MDSQDGQQTAEFWNELADFYGSHGRHDMLWRHPEPDGSFDPYKILVSELMLQQTQVARVTPKYVAFLERFPSVEALAAAPLGEVLKLWSGLGYNRRAKFLWQAAQQIVTDHNGVFPRSYIELLCLPGVGPNTAGAIMAYAYDEPVVYVETNIRTVIIHHFFRGESGVSDKAIKDVLAQLLPQREGKAADLSSREFYWAMMDYGAFLKGSVGNLNRAGAGYTRQSKFHGSRRQLRGQIIRLLIERPRTSRELQKLLDDGRAAAIIDDLVVEGMVKFHAGRLSLQ